MAEKISMPMLLILMALNRGERHGYTIMKEIEEMTGGDYSIPVGTLYRTLEALQSTGLIEEGSPLEVGEDARRKRYRITEHGRKASDAELQRMKRLIKSVEVLG